MADLFIIVQILLLLLLVASSAFFSGAETALFALGRARLIQYADHPRLEYRRIAELMRTYNQTLTALVGGNMLVNTGISVVLASLLGSLGLSSAWTMALSMFIAVAVLLVFGEITPKAVALQFAERFARGAATPVWWWRTLAAPVTVVIEWASARLLNLLGRRHSPPLHEDEYGDYVELANSIGTFSDQETDLLQQVFRLRRLRVNRIMTPRPDVTCVNRQLTPAAIAEFVHRHPRPFLPVVSESLDDTVAILSVRDFFAMPGAARTDWATSPAVFPAIFVPENASLSQAMAALTGRGVSAVLVADEYGGIVGMLEQTQIFEELVGDIANEYSQSAWQLRRDGPDAWRINGQMPLEALHELLPELPRLPAEANTLNGLFAIELDRMPMVGDQLEVAGVKLIARAIDRNRVVEASLHWPGSATPENQP